MISDRDIWTTANLLIRQHNEHAALEAAQRGDACLERGDMEGLAVWKRVIAAIDEPQRDRPDEGERVS